MAQIIKNITVDVAKRNLFQAIVAKQHDNNSRFLKVTLVNEGEIISIDVNSDVTINAKRADGLAKAFRGVVNDDNTVTVPLTLWMLELDDLVKCDITVIDHDGRKLTSTSFELEVEAAAYGDNEISEDEGYDLLLNLLNDVNDVINACEEATDAANKAANQAATNTEGKYTKPENGIPINDLSQEVQDKLREQIVYNFATTAAYDDFRNRYGGDLKRGDIVMIDSADEDGNTIVYQLGKNATDPLALTPVRVIQPYTGGSGLQGQRGTGFLAITTAPTSHTAVVNGLTAAYRISLNTVKSQAGVTEVFAGDTLCHSYYHYPVIHIDEEYVYCRASVSIRGSAGADAVIWYANVAPSSNIFAIANLYGPAGAVPSPGHMVVSSYTGRGYFIAAVDNDAVTIADYSVQVTGNPGPNGQPGQDGQDGGYYTVDVEQLNSTTVKLSFVPSKEGMEAILPEVITLPQGPKGDPGAAGHSPVRGTDYWTAADIAEIKSYVDEAILGGAW